MLLPAAALAVLGLACCQSPTDSADGGPVSLDLAIEANPHNRLSVLAQVTADQDATVVVHYRVEGGPAHATPPVDVAADGTETVLVLGLYADSAVEIEASLAGVEPAWEDAAQTWQTEPKPEGWPECQVVTDTGEATGDDVLCTNFRGVGVGAYGCYDRTGQLVWAVEEPDGEHIFAWRALSDGTLGMVASTRSVVTLLDPSGAPLRQYTPAFFEGQTRFEHQWIAAHELIEITEGSWTGAVAVLTTSTEVIREDNQKNGEGILVFDPDTGEVLWDWLSLGADLTDGETIDPALDFNEVGQHSEGIDWMHANALLHRVEGDRDIFWMNLRFLDRIIKIDTATDAVEWRLGFGGDFDLVEDLDAEPTVPADYPTGWIFQAHAPEWVESSGSRTRFLIFDNGLARPHYTGVEGEAYSRLVEYEIDEEQRRAAVRWEWGSDDPDSEVWMYGSQGGDADLSPSGDSVHSNWGVDSVQLAEVSRESGQVTWLLDCTGTDNSYRVEHYTSLYDMGTAVP